MFTTDLGLAAYQGKADEIKRALEKGVDWATEGEFLLSSAIFGHQWQIAREILRAGMPISDSTYKMIYYWADHSLLDELPSRPDILEPLQLDGQKTDFFKAVIDENLETARILFRAEWVNAESDILADRVSRNPLHYAARRCHFELIRFLLMSGADVNALTGDGQSALTLVSRCATVDRRTRRLCFKLVRSFGGEMVPPVKSWFEKWRLSRGNWSSS